MDMKATDITKIIKACSDAGVSKFKLGDVEIDFTTEVIESITNDKGWGTYIPENEYPKYDKSRFTTEAEEQTDITTQKEIDQELVAVEDPEEWERMALESLGQEN